MKYVLAFLAVFILVAGIALIGRFSGSEPPPTPDNTSVADTEDDDSDKESSGGGTEQPETDSPDKVNEFEIDVENTTDPITGEELGASHDVHAHYVHAGRLIHFASAESVERFKSNPVQYLQRLELEPLTDGGVKKVDAETYRTPPLPEQCPF